MNAAAQPVFKVLNSITEIAAADWDALTDGTPLLKHAFFAALENSGSVGKNTGWKPMPLILLQEGRLTGAVPLFLKNHSYGEYVFDWAWADAYNRSGVAYYPKLVAAIPFSPISSSRLLAHGATEKMQLVKALESIVHQHQLSGCHLLFPAENEASLMAHSAWLRRDGVQFRWENKNYADFEGFLQSLSHDKRKKIHQERKKLSQAGVVCRWITGVEASEADWDFFYQCYCNTYNEHYSTPYLTRAFFSLVAASMPQNIVLMMAEINGRKLAATLNFFNETTLYGRYWGATQFVPGLHFELCYYQAQQFCIAQNIRFFEGGAQGEHKLARGFEPRPTCSFHKIAHPQFEKAIRDFLRNESTGVLAYTTELEERAPFKAR